MQTPLHSVYRLRNPIRGYAWGSTTAIAELLGRPPSEEPQAEMWLGAHPSAPSEIRLDGIEQEGSEGGWQSLPSWIADHAEAVLGPQISRRWGFLPFLLKVLAAARPLSIQAHPDAEQARRGFAAEEARGVGRAERERNYPDDRHKPELIYAVSRFTVLRGFREPADIRRRLERVGLGGTALFSALGENSGATTCLRRLLGEFLDMPADAAARCVDRSLHEVSRRGAADEAEAWMPRLAREYGRDRGVLAPLFLHLRTLEPGQGLYTGAGVLHAYLEGLGIEVMASSDNVLRGALTGKHVDALELAKVVRYEALAPELTVGTVRGAEERFDTPADEFRLSVLRPADEAVGMAGGVQILLCTEGEGELRTTTGKVPFRRGDSFLVPYATGAYEMAGRATVFRATVG